MANITTVLKYSLKTNIVKSILFDIITNSSHYYYTFGRSSPWPTVTSTDEFNNVTIVSSEEDPPSASDNYSYELQVRNDILLSKLIDSNDVAIVTTRRNWIAGIVYDMYDEYSGDRASYTGAQSLDQASFYVITSEFNVYKCLFNNNDGISIIQPTGTDDTSYTSSDGYIWKFMYTIPLALRNKFLTTSYMPVLSALSNQFYSSGSITNYTIAAAGKNYTQTYYKVKNFNIINSGGDYVDGDITITFGAPTSGVGGATTAVASVNQFGTSGQILQITVSNPGSGYSSPPVPTITSTSGSGFRYSIDYDKDTTSGYTELVVNGDGYNKDNPYSVKTVNIIDRGVFSAPVVGEIFSYPEPDLPGGQKPDISVTFRPIDTEYEIDTITVNFGGYGYSYPLIFGTNVFASALTSGALSAADLDLNENSQKNQAELLPLINASGEIQAIKIVNSGYGYTYASVSIVSKKNVDGSLVDVNSTNTPGFVAGSVLLNFTVGDIDSKQSNVELFAVDGSIEVVKVDFGGFGYTANTTISISGDGTGCTAEAVIVNSTIDKIIVTNKGSGYTNATATIVGTTGEVNPAILRPIISPQGGHGKDCIAELYAKTLSFVSRLSSEKNQGLSPSNDYRQLTIVKNPKTYNADDFYVNGIGSTCAVFVCAVNTNNTTTYNNLSIDDVIYYSSTRAFNLIEKTLIDNKYYLLVQPLNNYIPSRGSNVYKISGASTYEINVSSIVYPDMNKYSGEMLYIDNRTSFAPSEEQSIALSTLISF